MTSDTAERRSFPSIVRCASEMEVLREAVRRECRFIDEMTSGQREWYTDQTKKGALVRITFQVLEAE